MKTHLSVLIIYMVTQAAIAQEQSVTGKESSYGFSVGYGLPLGSQYMDASYKESGITAALTGVYGSYGSGVNINGFFRRMFSTSLGIDLGINYLIGRQITANDDELLAGNPFHSTRQSSSKGIFLSPSLILKSKETRIKPFVKAGMIAGWTKITAGETQTYSQPQAVNVAEMKNVFQGGLPWGFKGAFGFEFNMSKNLFFYSELVFTAMNYYPTRSELTKFTINGSDQLASMSVYQRKVIYKSEINYSSSPSDQPSQQLKKEFAMGSIALNAGMRIVLR